MQSALAYVAAGSPGLAALMTGNMSVGEFLAYGVLTGTLGRSLSQLSNMPANTIEMSANAKSMMVLIFSCSGS